MESRNSQLHHLLAEMQVLASQAGLLGSNPIVWLCDQEPVKSVQKGPAHEKGKLLRAWACLSQFSLSVHDIQRTKEGTG